MITSTDMRASLSRRYAAQLMFVFMCPPYVGNASASRNVVHVKLPGPVARGKDAVGEMNA